MNMSFSQMLRDLDSSHSPTKTMQSLNKSWWPYLQNIPRVWLVPSSPGDCGGLLTATLWLLPSPLTSISALGGSLQKGRLQNSFMKNPNPVKPHTLGDPVNPGSSPSATLPPFPLLALGQLFLQYSRHILLSGGLCSGWSFLLKPLPDAFCCYIPLIYSSLY